MATRSFISIVKNKCTGHNLKEAENIFAIYCHWDGSPDTRLPILNNYYNTPEKVQALLEMGDCSALHNTLEECVFYRRDRDETGCDKKGYYNKYWLMSAAKKAGCEYVYIFDNNEWTYKAVNLIN